MNTVYFLAFIGLCAFAVVWFARTSKKKTDLAHQNKAHRARRTPAKLATPPDYPLAHGDHVWEKRRKRASMGRDDKLDFVPQSKAGSAPLYDGYSRRDRHHVAPTGVVKGGGHFEDRHGLTRTGIKPKNGDRVTQT